jgi:aerobic carbon-monoxide dehydrogenase large subunit
MPTAAEIPRIDLLVSEQAPAPGNPLGVRGAGEGGITAAGATLASAVRDALGGSQEVSALPLTPARVRAMAEAAPGQPARTLTMNAEGLTCDLFR